MFGRKEPMSCEQPLVYLTRVERFSAGHRLHNRCLDSQTNSQLYGKCNRIHGHNYRLKVTVKGSVDPVTGMVMDMTLLKKIISETVMDSLDHKHVDEDVAYFKDNKVVSTAENIAVHIWTVIQDKLPPSVALDQIKLHETDNNIVVFRGQYK